ncbi:MAG TPA: hypothetical protein VJN62_08575 [Gemmatimonadales bacterium]|nr:hypothetical protein [Gemmatimonadales bacterium]
MGLNILGGLSFALIFAAMAGYEHMSPWKWGLASMAVSLTVDKLFPLSFVYDLPAQFGLFLVLWWMNQRRKAALEVSRAEASAAEQARRRERVSRAAADAQRADPEREKREAERDAAEEAARQERIARVRMAREQREREEREQKGGGGGASTP